MARSRIPRRNTDELKDDKTNYLDKELEAEKYSQVYSTEKINSIMKSLSSGVKLDMIPFFHGKHEWKQAGIGFEYTKEEWDEIEKCVENPIYFVEKYCTFLTDFGRKTIKLRDYQKDVLHLLGDEVYNKELNLFINKNRKVILLQSRQTGKTTTTAAYIVSYIFRNTDRNIMVLANKGNTAEEILGKIKDIIKNLPFFLKPGVISVSKDSISFENGCSLRCSATSDTPATGDTIHVMMIDEAALIPASKMTPFWQSVYPTLSSSNVSQIIMMSTPRGKHNLFYQLWDRAMKKKNGFVVRRVDYWQVPGHDTEEWKNEQIETFGEANFNQEFGLSFESDATKLVGPAQLKLMNDNKKIFKPVDIYGIPSEISQKIYWHPDFHPDELTEEDLVRRHFLIQIDTAEGKMKGEKNKEDSDWNVIDIYEIEFMEPDIIEKNRLGYKEVKMNDCIRIRQIGIYMDHDFDEEHSADAAKHIVFTLFKNGQDSYMGEIDNCRINIEINFNGTNWIRRFSKHELFYNALILKTLHSQKAKEKEYGFKTVGGAHGKGYWCESGKKMIERSQIIITQDNEEPNMSSIQQLEAFGKNKNNVYEGSGIHDDIAVTIFFTSIAFENEDFISWIDDWFTILTESDIPFEIKEQLKTIGQFLDIYVTQNINEDDYTDQDYKELYGSSAENFGQINIPNNYMNGNMMNPLSSIYQNQNRYANNMMIPRIVK